MLVLSNPRRRFPPRIKINLTLIITDAGDAIVISNNSRLQPRPKQTSPYNAHTTSHLGQIQALHTHAYYQFAATAINSLKAHQLNPFWLQAENQLRAKNRKHISRTRVISE